MVKNTTELPKVASKASLLASTLFSVLSFSDRKLPFLRYQKVFRKSCLIHVFKMYSNVKVDKTCVLYLSESESLEKLANSSWTAETFVHIAYI